MAATTFRAAVGRLLAVLACTIAASLATAGNDAIFRSGFQSDPIVAPAGTWTWVPFGDAYCGNNSTTGIGINPSANGTRLLVFLTGGGACWDATTCITLQTASNFNTGFGPSEFNATLPALGASIFDRNSTTNPFRNYHYVFVPYCSGDLHFGNNPSISYNGNPRSHRGYTNLSSFLSRVTATFPTVNRVYLAGGSAGGFGAALNWTRVQQAFGNIRVDMIDDSGPFMPASIVSPTAPAELLRQTNWNLAATMPAGCPSCLTGGMDNIHSFNASQLPNNRGALLSYRPDSTIASFYQITQPNFTLGLNEILANRWAPFATRRYFIVGATGHVLITNLALISNGVSLETFLTRMESDDPGWANVEP